MKYTESHEWLHIQGNIGTIGVTDHAQHELGDIVYVELPIIGKSVKKGDEIAVLESTKAAADVYTPVSGLVIEVNDQLKDHAELINTSPQKEGWLYKIELKDLGEVENLLDETEYEILIKR